MMWALALTLLVWTGRRMAGTIRTRVGLNPVLVSTIVIVVVLLVTRAPLAEYQEGTLPLTALLVPAIVALALPIRRHGEHLERGATILVARSTSKSVQPGPSSGAESTKASSTSMRTFVKRSKSSTVPVSTTVSSNMTP